MGMLRVVSAPEGAEVRDARGQWVGTTNTGLLEVRVGEEYFFTIRKSGYRPLTIQGKVPQTVVTEPLVLFASLENFSPPQAGDKWEDHLGNSYQPVGGEHVSSGFVGKEDWAQFVESTARPGDVGEFLKMTQNGVPTEVALSSSGEAEAYCEWFRQGGLKTGFLTEDHEVVPAMEASFENPGLSERARRDGLKPFRVVVRQIDYGEITLITHPTGVEVWMNTLADPANRLSVGSTLEPLVIPKIKPNEWQLYLVREGYKPLTLDVKVGKGETDFKRSDLGKESRGDFRTTVGERNRHAFRPARSGSDGVRLGNAGQRL